MRKVVTTCSAQNLMICSFMCNCNVACSSHSFTLSDFKSFLFIIYDCVCMSYFTARSLSLSDQTSPNKLQPLVMFCHFDNKTLRCKAINICIYTPMNICLPFDRRSCTVTKQKCDSIQDLRFISK